MKQRLLFLSMLFFAALVGCGQSTLQKAEEAAENGELETALVGFTDALTEELTPDERFRALKGRAELYDQQENETAAVDDFEDAADQLERIIENKPEEIFLLVELASLHTRLESWDEAVEATNKFLEIDETDGSVRADVLSIRGKARLELRDFEGAIDDLKASLELEVDDASTDVENKQNLVDAYSRLAKALRELGEYEDAVTNYGRALEYADNIDDQAFLYSRRGFAYIEMGDETENALADLDQAIALDPTMALAYAYRSNAYSDEGNHEASMADANKAIELGDELSDSFRSTLYHARAVTHKDIGNYEQAIEDATKSIELEEDEASTARTYYLRSSIHSALGNDEEALADANYAIEVGANDIPMLDNFYERRSYANYNSGNLEEALVDIQAAIEIGEPTAVDYEYEGDVYYALNQFDEAIASYQSAIQLEPENAWLHNYLGDIYYETDQFGEAETEYRATIRLDDEVALFHENLGYALRANEKWEDAVEAYDDALALDADRAYSYYGRGYAHYWLDNNDDAISDLEKALTYDIEPDLADFINELLDEMNG